MFIFRYVFFFLCLHTFIQATPYEHYIVEVLNHGHTLKLEDESYWEIKEGFEEVRKWQTGDLIALEVKFKLWEDRDYFFKNLRLQTCAQISHLLDAQLPENSIYTIETGKYNSYVRLNDASIWNCCFLTCPSTHCDLKIDDRIFIFKASDSEGHYLIKWDAQNANFNDIQYATLRFNPKATPYRHFIAKIMFDEISGETTIHLDNGFIWNWRRSFFFRFKSNSYNIMEEWKVGDEICLDYEAMKRSTRDNVPYIDFYMINLRNFHKIGVSYLHRDYSEVETGTYWTIENLVINQSQGLFAPIHQVIMTLNDGSSWEIRDRSIQRWQIGDPVLISSDINSSTENWFVIINPKCGLTKTSGWFSSNIDNYINSAVYAKKL